MRWPRGCAMRTLSERLRAPHANLIGGMDLGESPPSPPPAAPAAAPPAPGAGVAVGVTPRIAPLSPAAMQLVAERQLPARSARGVPVPWTAHDPPPSAVLASAPA